MSTCTTGHAIKLTGQFELNNDTTSGDNAHSEMNECLIIVKLRPHQTPSLYFLMHFGGVVP